MTPKLTVEEMARRKRLYEAAPDLLAALERLTGNSWAVGSLALDDSLAQARAAIAKAKGA